MEQDADLVMFIYRDEYYNDESDQQGLAEIHLAKHRNGPTDSVKLSWLSRYTKFTDLAAIAVNDRQVIWVRAEVTSFTCLCEECLSSPSRRSEPMPTARPRSRDTCATKPTSASRAATAATASPCAAIAPRRWQTALGALARPPHKAHWGTCQRP